MKRAIIGAGLVTALLLLYVWFVGVRAVALVQTGQPAAVAIGVVAFVIPAVTIWFIVVEWRQATAVAKMFDVINAEGSGIVDDLPRSPGGRIDRAAATEQFAGIAARAADAPDDWRSWFHLGWAYDAAGDRRRARTTLRTAANMFHRSSSSGRSDRNSRA